MTPLVTVVVPTHNRRAALLRLLHALERTVLDAADIEVVVVADGCSDGTAAAVRAECWIVRVIVIEQPASGAAAARNRGAASASGRILLFLDDDVEPQTGMLQAHIAFHERCTNGVGLGDLPVAVTADGFFGIILRGWWYGMYEGARQCGHRYAYYNLLSGHFSIAREWFDRIGGFDAEFLCHEDWELGYRAIAAGMELRFLPDACAVHHDETTLEKTLARKFADGVGDVQLITRYPELAADLPLGRPQSEGWISRALVRLAWSWPRAGDVVASALPVVMRIYEAARLRYRWRGILGDALDYAYWRGVATAVGDRKALGLKVTRSVPSPPEFVVDLREGIGAAKARLDSARPSSVRLVFGDDVIGDVPPRAGAERLRGDHLPRLIATHFAREYVRAAADAGVLPVALTSRSEAAPRVRNPLAPVGAQPLATGL